MCTATTSRGTEPRIASYSPAGQAYRIDERLTTLVDSMVERRWSHGDSLDDTVDDVAALIRTTAPNDLADTDPEWEPRWRAYFAFYDHAIMQSIRAYVEREAGA